MVITFLSKKNKKIALNNFNLDIQENDCIAVLGKNGSGKSTLLRLIGNILTPDEGELKLSNTMIDTSYISGNERFFFEINSI